MTDADLGKSVFDAEPGVPAAPSVVRPSGWQDDPLEGAWWLTLFMRVWFFFDRR